MATAFFHPLSSSAVHPTFLNSNSRISYPIANLKASNSRSFADVVIDRSFSSSQFVYRPPFSHRTVVNWIDCQNGKRYCFPCGDLSHLANVCREPIRCFRCGNFGHKRNKCLMKFNAPSTSGVSNGFVNEGLNFLSIQDHGFQFMFKCMKLKRILLDNLSVQRDEGIAFLEELFKHFETIDEVNIGRGYRSKFGDPADYFGNYGSSNKYKNKDGEFVHNGGSSNIYKKKDGVFVHSGCSDVEFYNNNHFIDSDFLVV